MPGYLDSQSGLYFGWDVGEDGWGVPTNRSLRQLAYGGLSRSVKGTVSSPPSNPTLGDKYIVGVNPTGWGITPAPLEHQIIVYGRELSTPTNFSWQVFQSRVGDEVFDESRGIRVHYYEGSWQEVRPTQNQPILTDDTITGDGITTPLSRVPTPPVQSDWAITSPSDPRFILNKPTIPRTTETVLWQSGPINLSTSVSGTRFITLGSVSLSNQARLGHNFGLVTAGGGPELRLGFGCRITLTHFKSANKIRIQNNHGEYSSEVSSLSEGQSRQVDMFAESRQVSYDLTFRITGNDSRFIITGNWYAGLLISP